MTSVLRERSYALLSEGRWRGSASAVHEPSPVGPYRASSIASAGPSDRETVALLVAERDWEPPLPRFAHDQIVGLRVRVWQLRYDRVVALGLSTRIVDEPASNSGCLGSSGENLRADARAASR